jgi:hypothetical protein
MKSKIQTVIYKTKIKVNFTLDLILNMKESDAERANLDASSNQYVKRREKLLSRFYN